MNAADRGVLLLLWDGIRDYLNRWRDDDRAFAAFAEGMPADIKLPAGYDVAESTKPNRADMRAAAHRTDIGQRAVRR